VNVATSWSVRESLARSATFRVKASLISAIHASPTVRV
jgi:hypothetical protein